MEGLESLLRISMLDKREDTMGEKIQIEQGYPEWEDPAMYWD